jgi:hypothetical protein
LKMLSPVAASEWAVTVADLTTACGKYITTMAYEGHLMTTAEPPSPTPQAARTACTMHTDTVAERLKKVFIAPPPMTRRKLHQPGRPVGDNDEMGVGLDRRIE